MRPAALAIMIAIFALTESAIALYHWHTPASDKDWAAAAERVRRDMQPDDLVVFAPAWVDPVGRQHLGDRIPVSMAARSDDDTYARIWELSIRDAHADDTAGLAPELVEHFGGVTVRRFDKQAVKVLRDLTADFPSARVSSRAVGDGADEHPCMQRDKARVCGSTTIEPRVMEIDYRPRRGILTPAIPNQVVSVAYDDVPGDSVLVGYAGLHDYYARKTASGVAFFRARVDNSQTITLPLRNDSGWKRFEMPLGPGKHQVVFEVQSDQPASRLPGFHAEVRAPEVIK